MTRRADVRICPVCQGEFFPSFRKQVTCGEPPCVSTQRARTLKARGTPAPLARQQRVNVERREARIRHTCQQQFSTLTVRELALFAFAHAEGYSRGYSRGYHATRRSGAGKAGAA